MKKKIHIDTIVRRAFAHVGMFAAIMLLFPMVTFGASSYCSGVSSTLKIEDGNTSVSDVLKFGTCLIEQAIIPLMFAFATATFIYGVIKFIKEEKAEEREKGRQFMLWGIIGFAVMLGVWGFVAIISNTFGVTDILPILPQSSNP